jgi:hypothetical protein
MKYDEKSNILCGISFQTVFNIAAIIRGQFYKTFLSLKHKNLNSLQSLELNNVPFVKYENKVVKGSS